MKFYAFVIFLLFLGSCTEKVNKVKTNNGSSTQNNEVYKFSIKGKQYELILINKTWEEAAKYAKEKGGYLVEIKL